MPRKAGSSISNQMGGKSENNIYPFSQIGFNLGDLKGKLDEMSEPLTLFAPHLDEHEPPEGVELDRPVTPIDEQIKAPPATFNGLAKLVRRRIVAKPEIEHLSVDDQQALAAIIMGEVNGIWPDYRQQVADPFMSPEGNRELQRRITVHIVTVCEQLFNYYIEKAQILNKRGVFSGPANMSRLKAQLGLDSNKYLNILTIRRYISNDMRSRQTELVESTPRKSTPFVSPPGLSYRGLIEASRPKTRMLTKPILSLEEEITEIKKNIPSLDTTKLVQIIEDIPNERTAFSRLSEKPHESKQGFQKKDFRDIPRRHRKQKDLKQVRKGSEELSKEKVVLKRSDSLPRLYKGDLLDELGMEEAVGRRSAMSVVDLEDTSGDVAETSKTYRTKQEHMLGAAIEKPEPGTREYAAEDLRKLLGRVKDTKAPVYNMEEDLPPLIQVNEYDI